MRQVSASVHTAGTALSQGLPRLASSFVPTPALLEIADSGWPPLVVLQAPRGFGKTSAATWLLRQDQEMRHKRIWVSLMPGQTTVEELWEAVRRRLQLRGLDASDWTELQALLTGMKSRLLVAVDGLDQCELDVDEHLAAVVRTCDRVHVVATTRANRPLMEHATLLDGVLLRRNDLALDRHAGHDLARLIGVQASERAVAELVDQVGGWPVLLTLAMARSLVSPDGSIIPDQPAIDRFLAQWWQELPETVRTALGILAVPAEITVELALTLLGTPDPAEIERQLSDSGFVDDSVEFPFTYPDMLRAGVLAAFKADDPENYRQAHAVAASWFAQHSAPVPALRHAIDAGDVVLTERLLTHHWALLVVTQPDLTREAIGLLPAEVIGADVRLVVAHDYVLNLFVDDRAKTAFHAGVLVPGESRGSRVGQRLTVQESLTLRARGLVDSSHVMLESADLAEIIAASSWTPEVVAAVPQVLLDWATDLLQRAPGFTAIYGFVEAFAWAQHLGQDQVSSDAAAGAALAHALVGHCRWAQLWLAERARSSAGTQVGDIMETFTRAVICRDSLQRPPDLDDLVLPTGLADLQVIRLWVQASDLVRTGRSQEAVRLLDPFGVTEKGSVPGLVDLLLVSSRADALVASGRIDTARTMLQELDPAQLRYPTSWVLVDVQSGNYQRALEVDPQGLLPRQRADITMLRAKASLMVHHRAEAIDLFQNVVGMVERLGAVRPFALVSDDTLAELSQGDLQAQELLASVSATPLYAATSGGAKLSPRELEVLEVVATGAPFAVVARKLFVSPNTVKSQMRIIYRKLDVGGRAEAVVRAQELGLLTMDATAGSLQPS